MLMRLKRLLFWQRGCSWQSLKIELKAGLLDTSFCIEALLKLLKAAGRTTVEYNE